MQKKMQQIMQFVSFQIYVVHMYKDHTKGIQKYKNR